MSLVTWPTNGVGLLRVGIDTPNIFNEFPAQDTSPRPQCCRHPATRQTLARVDVGVRRLATVAAADGVVIEQVANPRPLAAALRELRHVSRARSRCTKGSRRYRERTTEISRLHRRVNDIRTHHLHVLTKHDWLKLTAASLPDRVIRYKRRFQCGGQGFSECLTKRGRVRRARGALPPQVRPMVVVGAGGVAPDASDRLVERGLFGGGRGGALGGLRGERGRASGPGRAAGALPMCMLPAPST